MKRVTLKGLNRIAEDHNRHNMYDDWTWRDVIYEQCLNGNDVKEDFDHMSRKELFIVVCWAARNYNDELSASDRRVWGYIYNAAKDSLMRRL